MIERIKEWFRAWWYPTLPGAAPTESVYDRFQANHERFMSTIRKEQQDKRNIEQCIRFYLPHPPACNEKRSFIIEGIRVDCFCAKEEGHEGQHEAPLGSYFF